MTVLKSRAPDCLQQEVQRPGLHMHGLLLRVQAQRFVWSSTLQRRLKSHEI